jgi:protein tyrosine phosphatase (PTP) superfamily phosphohydrolase (DUF442 family)
VTFAAVSGAQDDKQSPPTQHSMGSRKNAVGLPNFGEVTPLLFRGGQPGVDGFETLKNMGVSIVVDMRTGHNQHEKDAVTKLGMKYVSIPWHCPMPTDEPFAKFLKVIHDNPGQKVFVHCRLGDDRTGMAVASYRMAEEGWSADEAMKEMKDFGFRGWHRSVCFPLNGYEKEFPEHLKTNPAFKELQAEKK